MVVPVSGRDLIGLAQTGSGKTGAFAIPVLQALLENAQPLFAVVLAPTRSFCCCCWISHIFCATPPWWGQCVFVLVVLAACCLSASVAEGDNTPLRGTHRELAFQIQEQFEALGGGIGARCATIVGGIGETCLLAL